MTAPPMTAASPGDSHYLQLGAFGSAANAEASDTPSPKVVPADESRRSRDTMRTASGSSASRGMEVFSKR